MNSSSDCLSEFDLLPILEGTSNTLQHRTATRLVIYVFTFRPTLSSDEAEHTSYKGEQNDSLQIERKHVARNTCETPEFNDSEEFDNVVCCSSAATKTRFYSKILKILK
jgi:hypothetical protein